MTQAERERAEMDRYANTEAAPSPRLRPETSIAPMLKLLDGHRESWRKTQRDVCPTCTGHLTATAMTCVVRGAGPDADNAPPICRWRDAVERDNAAAERLATRRERLVRSGVEDAVVLDLIVNATTPPMPPNRHETSPEFKEMWRAVNLFLREPSRLCLTLYSPPGCLHGDTPIHDPIDGSTRAVSERWLLARPFHVWSIDAQGQAVVAAACPPQKSAPQQMMKFTTSSGESVTVTPGHRFWTGSRWIYASEVYELLQGSEPVLLASISGSDLQARAQGGSHWMQTTQGSQDDCRTERRSRDGQPLAVQGTAPTFAPSQADAHGHLRDGLGADDLSLSTGRIHPHPPSARRSRSSSFPSENRTIELCLLPPGLRRRSVVDSTQSTWPSPQETFPVHKLNEHAVLAQSSMPLYASDPPTDHQWSNSNRTIGSESAQQCNVTAVELLPVASYFDFHVPVFNSYWASGLWHHNCGKSLACAWIVASASGSYLLNPRATMVPRPEWDMPRSNALNCSLLVIEDLGWEHDSNWHKGEVQGLIMARADKGRRTAISTNLHPGDPKDLTSLCGRYGPAVWSRLRAESRGSLMVFAGSDDLRRGTR